MSHHLKRHKWVNGELQSFAYSFETFEEAKAFADNTNSSEAHTVKVYDERGQLVHEISPQVINTYA
jgi:hypothetical protein